MSGNSYSFIAVFSLNPYREDDRLLFYFLVIYWVEHIAFSSWSCLNWCLFCSQLSWFNSLTWVSHVLQNNDVTAMKTLWTSPRSRLMKCLKTVNCSFRNVTLLIIQLMSISSLWDLGLIWLYLYKTSRFRHLDFSVCLKVPLHPKHLWTQLSSVDSTSVDTDNEQYEPSNDPSAPLSTFHSEPCSFIISSHFVSHVSAVHPASLKGFYLVSGFVVEAAVFANTVAALCLAVFAGCVWLMPLHLHHFDSRF